MPGSKPLYLRTDVAFAKPEVYKLLEHEGIRYAIRLPANPGCSGGSSTCLDEAG